MYPLNKKLMNNLSHDIEIYTDGSCHTQLKIGAWAAIIIVNNKKEILKGKEFETTHNRMELLAVINSIKHVLANFSNFNLLKIYSDSQYVVNLNNRKEKLLTNKFITKKGKELNNIDLLAELISFMEMPNIKFIKVKAHQKQTEVENINIEVDIIVRQIVRDAVYEINFRQ